VEEPGISKGHSVIGWIEHEYPFGEPHLFNGLINV